MPQNSSSSFSVSQTGLTTPTMTEETDAPLLKGLPPIFTGDFNKQVDRLHPTLSQENKKNYLQESYIGTRKEPSSAQSSSASNVKPTPVNKNAQNKQHSPKNNRRRILQNYP
jgi:hypothetical protein